MYDYAYAHDMPPVRKVMPELDGAMGDTKMRDYGKKDTTALLVSTVAKQLPGKAQRQFEKNLQALRKYSLDILS